MLERPRCPSHVKPMLCVSMHTVSHGVFGVFEWSSEFLFYLEKPSADLSKTVIIRQGVAHDICKLF